jgi:hypothetical protein
MKKYTFIAIFIFAIIAFSSASIFAQTDDLKFDSALAADFSKGMSGDADTLKNATDRAEKILAANPQDARTLVWLGAATLTRSGKYFMSGNFAEGGKNWKEGRRKMDEAVTLDGENVEILMTRGSTYLTASKQFPVKEEAQKILQLGIGDYEKVAANSKFSKFPENMRSQVLNGLANGYERLSNKEKAKTCYQRLSAEATGEIQANAVKWLAEHQD